MLHKLILIGISSFILALAGCGGGSSSSGGGGGNLTTGPAPSPDNNFFYRVDASCGSGDVYRNGILKKGNLQPGGVVQDTYPPGNHQLTLMPVGEPFNSDKSLDDDLKLNVSGNINHTFVC